jgi:hypothetical protein
MPIQPHDGGCPDKGKVHSAEANRVSDMYRLHRLADHFGSIGQWFACRLTDGTSDDTLYPSKSVAIKHQHHNEKYFAFIQIVPSDMTVCDAEIFLKVQRRLYDKGLRQADPDARGGGPQMIPRLTREDMGAQMRAITRGTQPTNLRYGRRSN